MSDNQQPQYSYDTLSEAVIDLIIRGYTTDFLMQEEKECLLCTDNSLELSPEDFVIDEVYRLKASATPLMEASCSRCLQ